MKHRIFICKQCNRKRWIFDLGYRYAYPNTYHVWKCSKGHYWENKILRTEEIVQIMTDVMKDKVTSLFDRDDTFFSNLKR